MKVHGCNKFKIPHMKKERLERQGTLPLQIDCETLVLEAMLSLRHGTFRILDINFVSPNVTCRHGLWVQEFTIELICSVHLLVLSSQRLHSSSSPLPSPALLPWPDQALRLHHQREYAT
jgi:hypothetical protein